MVLVRHVLAVELTSDALLPTFTVAPAVSRIRTVTLLFAALVVAVRRRTRTPDAVSK
jgi:hypothetical protein